MPTPVACMAGLVVSSGCSQVSSCLAHVVVLHKQRCLTKSRLLRCAQALLDVFTIQQEIGRLDNLRIGLVGDLANGRTARSLAFLMSLYSNIKFYFVAPDVVKMKDDIKQFLDYKKVGIANEPSCRGLLVSLGCPSPGAMKSDGPPLHLMVHGAGAKAPDCLQVQYEDVDDLAAVAADVDILYQTRIQKERFQVLNLLSSISAVLEADASCQHPAAKRCTA